MNLNAIKTLIEAMQASDLTEMAVSGNGWSLRMRRRGASITPPPSPQPTVGEAPPPPPDAAEPERAETPPEGTEVRAPLAGIVHLTPSPGEPPFVEPGRRVTAGTTLCLIEAMKVFMPIRAERDGTVEAVLVSAVSEVEEGQTLMRII